MSDISRVIESLSEEEKKVMKESDGYFIPERLNEELRKLFQINHTHNECYREKGARRCLKQF